MSHDEFHRNLVALFAQPPIERYQGLAALHTEVTARYTGAVRGIKVQGAAHLVPGGRTVAQVVGHVAEWERALVMALAEVVAGVEWPRIFSRTGYLNPDGTTYDYHGIHAFNAHHAARHAATPWPEIQSFALDIAVTLHRFFTMSGLVTPERLERTRMFEGYRLPIGESISTPAGWALWLIAVEHEGVEHEEDLAVGLD